jgi:hypothetical protein
MTTKVQLLEEIGDALKEAVDEIVERQEAKWASLSKDDQLDVFCSVIRRLKNAELEEFRSFRGTLYDTFQFGPEAYVLAQEAGFLELHNAIWDAEQIKMAIHHFAVSELGLDPKDEELDEKIIAYIKRMKFSK